MKKIIRSILSVILIAALFTLGGCSECDHEWREANCIEPKTCTKCGATEGEPLGHDWAPATCTEPKTCRRCGATEGEPLDHDWAPATCTEPKTCRRCGATEGEPLGHDWIEATCSEPRRCKRCGYREGKPLGHDWQEATCTECKTCKRCGLTVGLPLGHDAPDLTCTTDGVCRRCGETIPAPGHDWAPATCTEPKTCRRCGATEGEPLGHTTSNGVCSRCGKEIYETVTGSGDDVISDIVLDNDRLYRVHFTHSGYHNFIVELYDQQNHKDLLINEIGNYDGRVFITGESPLTFEIKAGGQWSYTIEPLEPTTDTEFSGTGDYVTDKASLSSGAFLITHDGDHNFIVEAYTTDGRDLLVNEIGNYTGKVMVIVPDGSLVMFRIIADGNWTIERA